MDAPIITAATPRTATYTATAGQTAFPIPFAYFAQAEVRVIVYRDDVQVASYAGGDGSMTCAPTANASVVTGVAGTATIPARTVGDEVVVYAVTAGERDFDFSAAGVKGASVDREFNRRVAIEAELRAALARSLKLRLGSSVSSDPLIWEIGGEAFDLGTLGADVLLSPGWRAMLATPRTEYSAEAYRQDGDDDTAAAQRAADACDAAGGGRLYFPAKSGGWVFKRAVQLGSNTWAYGDGDATVIHAHQTEFEGTAEENDCYLFRNKNWDADELTDHDIVVSDLKVDYGEVEIAGGGAHAICMRYAERLLVENVTSNSGDNCTAFLACRDFWTVNSVAYFPRNCGFDQWMGSGEAHVLNCTVYGLVGTTAQGIQLTGTGTFNEDLYSEDIKIMGCSVYDVRSNGQSSGIILNANDAGSGVRNGLVQGNTVVGCDNAIVAAGNGGGHMIKNNKIRDTVVTGVLVQEEGATSSGRVPSDCVITGNDFNECDTDVASPGLISIGGGAGHFIAHNRGNGGDYAYWLWLSAETSACVAIDNFIPDGETGSVLDQGEGNRVRAVSSVFPALGDYGRVTGLAATDVAIAIAGAEASGKIVRTPEGLHKTTAIASAAGLVGRYNGDGQIVTNDNNKRAPYFRAISSPPASYGNHDSLETAFNGEMLGPWVGELRVTGALTLQQPTTGYVHNYEVSLGYFGLYNASGHNQSTSTNGGRTCVSTFHFKVHQYGQGDAFAITAGGIVGSQKAGATHFLSHPAAGAINGTWTLGVNYGYLNAIEFNLDTNSFDGAVASVINIARDSIVGGQASSVVGWRIQSLNLALDAAFSASGAMKTALDTTAATTTYPIIMKVDQYINLEGTNSDPSGLPVGITPGDTYLGRAGGGFINVVYDNTSILQANTYWINAPAVPYNSAFGYKVSDVLVVDPSRGVRYRAYTDTQLNDITHAVNTADKAEGKTVWNSTQKRLVTADGATAAAVWASEGATRNTPV